MPEELRQIAEASSFSPRVGCGQTANQAAGGISYDSFEDVTTAMEMTFLHHDRTSDLNCPYQKMDGLTAEDLHAVAQEPSRS